MRVLLFGDSIAFGKNDPEFGGWAGRLRKYLDCKENKNVFINLSVSWETSKGLLSRIERETKVRIRNRPPEDFLIIIAVGINDSLIRVGETNPFTPEKIFRRNIKKIIQISKNLGVHILIVGLLPVYEKKTSPFKDNSFYSNDKIEIYNQILGECAKKEEVLFKGFLPGWKSKRLDKLLDDGLHPNKKGHEMIYGEMKEFLASNY